MIFSLAFFLTGLLAPVVSQCSGLLSPPPCHWSPTKSAFLTQLSWLAVNLTGLTSTSELNCLLTRAGASHSGSSARLILTRLGEKSRAAGLKGSEGSGLGKYFLW